MYNFVLQTIVLISLGAIIYLFARALPRVSEAVSLEPRRRSLEEFLKKIPLEKADAFSSYWLERFLRKLKIVILRFDNLLTKHLKNLKQRAVGNGGKLELFDNQSVTPPENKDSGNLRE